MKMERALFELTARAHLMDVLQTEGVKIALPVGESDMDILATVESCRCRCPAAWVPVTVVADCADGLSGNLQRAVAPGLLVALVWEIGDPDAVRAYAFTPAELIVVKRIAVGNSSARHSRAGLNRKLESFAMTAGRWRGKLMTMLESDSAAGV
jgi:hypothetical protein